MAGSNGNGHNGEIITHECRLCKTINQGSAVNCADYTFHFYRTPQAPALIQEIFADNYKVLESKLEFRTGDVILDLGANEGIFSIFMSKLFPQTTIYALEPVPRTFAQLMRNIGLNGCTNIHPHMCGVGRRKETIPISVGKNDYSGGSSSYLTHNSETMDQTNIAIYSLNEIWDMLNLDRVRLLKIDVEGAEYDALYPFTHMEKVDYLTGEFHMNERLSYQSRRMDALATWCSNLTNVIYIDTIRMAE